MKALYLRGVSNTHKSALEKIVYGEVTCNDIKAFYNKMVYCE